MACYLLILKKAFDTIDHKKILRKLANFRVDQSGLRFFASYSHVCNRSQKCSVNGALSSASKLTCEVPQGSILGPLLFLIYINDPPNCLVISCAKMFADDTGQPGCTFAELEQATNSELIDLYSWLKANKLSLNITKTEFKVTKTRQKFLAESCSEINIKLDSQPICRVENAKSLRLIIDDRLSWSYPTSFPLLYPRLGWIEF